MEAWQAVMLGLAALLVGATLPALVQLTLALRSVRASAARADQVLTTVGAAAERLDRLVAAFESGERGQRLLGALESLTRLAGQLEGVARVATSVGAAVGPAFGAAVRSWRASAEDVAGPPKAGGAAATTTK